MGFKMWIWIAAAFSAYFIKGLCGFANTLVFSTVMGFGVNNIDISPVEVVLGYPSNFILAWRNRKLLKTGLAVPMSILVLAGCIPGAFILKYFDARYIKLFFGAVIVMVGLEMLLRGTGRSADRASGPVFAVVGLISGILCGMFGVGALMAAYLNRITSSADEFKANVSAVFFVENTFRIILYSVMGVITADSLKQTVVLLPVMLGGLFAGIGGSRILNERIVKRLVTVLLIVSGAVLVITNV